jgi:hypothetical protein
MTVNAMLAKPKCLRFTRTRSDTGVYDRNDQVCRLMVKRVESNPTIDAQVFIARAMMDMNNNYSSASALEYVAQVARQQTNCPVAKHTRGKWSTIRFGELTYRRDNDNVFEVQVDLDQIDRIRSSGVVPKASTVSSEPVSRCSGTK